MKKDAEGQRSVPEDGNKMFIDLDVIESFGHRESEVYRG